MLYDLTYFISIPDGSIKRRDESSTLAVQNQFQFQMVRLKGKRWRNHRHHKAISIPDGSIKSTAGRSWAWSWVISIPDGSIKR